MGRSMGHHVLIGADILLSLSAALDGGWWL